MTVNERKKSIMEHLSLTSNLNFKSRSQSSKVQAPPIKQTISITPDSRKKSINEHLARSSANFNCFSLSSKERKQQIQQHVRLSRS